MNLKLSIVTLATILHITVATASEPVALPPAPTPQSQESLRPMLNVDWSAGAPIGSRIDPASITLDGVPVDPAGTYRITVNAFLADGGDGFTVLRSGTHRVTGAVDVDVLEAYLTARNPLPVPALDRVTVLP